jgi:lipoprotein-anchoring transpeptidase ErfK/SrfK
MARANALVKAQAELDASTGEATSVADYLGFHADERTSIDPAPEVVARPAALAPPIVESAAPTPVPEPEAAEPEASEQGGGYRVTDASRRMARHSPTYAAPVVESYMTVSQAALQEALRYFKVVVVVNKAECPHPTPTDCQAAQKARLYRDGALADSFEVSTGTERLKKPPASPAYVARTPLGWHTPQILLPRHFSRLWRGPMNYAVFFAGGIALHATGPDHYKHLGHRASGGCVRFREDHAVTVFNAVREAGVGRVPRLNRAGGLVRNERGEVEMRAGYNTLIIVENVPESTSS